MNLRNTDLVNKLVAEQKEYKDRVNKISHFLDTGKAGELDSYDLGLLQDQREELIRLVVILDLRIRSLKSYL